MNRKKPDGRSKYRNPYYDSKEFRNRWFSSETVESIALDLDVTMQAVRRAALHRDFPVKKIANRIPQEGTT